MSQGQGLTLSYRFIGTVFGKWKDFAQVYVHDFLRLHWPDEQYHEA